jgi:hypothetical protein
MAAASTRATLVVRRLFRAWELIIRDPPLMPGVVIVTTCQSRVRLRARLVCVDEHGGAVTCVTELMQ